MSPRSRADVECASWTCNEPSTNNHKLQNPILFDSILFDCSDSFFRARLAGLASWIGLRVPY